MVALLSNYVTGPLGAPLTVAGLALSAHYFLDTLFRGPSGYLVDSWGSKRVLLVGVGIEVVAFFGLMNTASALGAIAFVALLGVGTATHWPAVVTGTNRLTGQASRASAMSLVFAAWLAGSGLGLMVINFLMHGRDRTAFAILILVDLAAWSLVIAVQSPELDPKRPAPHPMSDWLRTLWPFRFILPGMFLQNMTLGLMLPIFEPYVNRVLHLTHWQFAVLLVGGGAIAVGLLWPMGRVTDRLGLRLPLIGGFFVAAFALFLLGFTRHFYLLVGLGGILGFAYAMILPSWNAFLGRLVPKGIEGWHWGVFMTFEGLGMAVGPTIGTRLFEMAVWAPFVFSALILLVMGFFYWLFPFDAYWSAHVPPTRS